MHYLIQENVFKDPRYNNIFEVMKELELSYEEIQFYPNSTIFDFKTDRKDIFVYGSVKLAKVATKFDWTPGSYYGNNHEYDKYSIGYGNNILNFGSFICEFTEKFDWNNQISLFIKPSRDAKVFTGKVFSKPEWEDLVYNTLNNKENNRVKESTLIQVAKAHRIIKEARIWIVNKQIVTSSYYLFHGDVRYEETVSDEGLKFAKEMAEIYNVADAYVMDIGKTYDGWKIMEVNCINSAGFYKAEVKKIVLALEKLYT